MMQGTGGELAPPPAGHNRPPLTKAELEQAFRERTRADRITESTPFDLKWQWEVWLSDLPSSAMLVAFAIRIYANQDGTKSHPSLDTLAMMTKLSRRHVQDSLKLIEKTLVRKTAGAGRAPNRYALIIPGETLQELATVIDIRSRAPRASQDDRNRAPGASQDDSVVGHPVPHKPVVGQIQDRSRAPGAPDITRDITRKGEHPREGSIGKVASLVAAGMTAMAPLAAAAQPHPVEQVMQDVAECWQNQKARMAAELSRYEKQAQREIWITPTRSVEVAGEFRSELVRTFPLVDLVCGLAAAAPNAAKETRAIDAMTVVRRQFAYLQNDNAGKEKRAASYRKPQPGSDDDLAQYPPEVRARILAARAAKGAPC
jgi:hypothetical protein